MNTTFHNSKTSRKRGGERAYSLVELLTVVGIISILGGLGVMTGGLVTRTAQKSKLKTDITTINSAIKVYVANGGDLTGLSSPTDVLNKLKTTRSAADQKLHTGAPSGRMIDPRIVAETVTVTDWRARAQYSPVKKQFVIVPNDTSGIRFDLDENLNEMTIPVEARSHGVANYAQNETWVWDHGALVNPNGPTGPSGVDTGTAPPNTTPPGGGGTPPEPEPEPPGGGGGGGGGGPDPDPDPDPEPEPEPDPDPVRLPYPNYNLAGGAHPDVDFPLSLSLTNVPNASIANAVIQVGSGAWQPYSGAVTVPMNTRVKAQYRAIDSSTHLDSWTNNQFFFPVATSLSGKVKGSFHTPQGGENLDTTISEGGKFFSNGDPTVDLGGEIIDAGEPNTLEFKKSNIGSVAPGEQFKIGDLFYHNGTTFNDSHATGVVLQLEIKLNNPNQTLTFDLNMDLVNTDNTSDDDASADYVKITNLTQAVPLTINGVGYEIQLEFGGTDSFGFSTSNQFHVYEGATGQGEIRATFVAKP